MLHGRVMIFFVDFKSVIETDLANTVSSQLFGELQGWLP